MLNIVYFADIGSNSTATSGHNDDDFDMFAQSRKSFETNKQAMGWVYRDELVLRLKWNWINVVIRSRKKKWKMELVIFVKCYF